MSLSDITIVSFIEILNNKLERDSKLVLNEPESI